MTFALAGYLGEMNRVHIGGVCALDDTRGRIRSGPHAGQEGRNPGNTSSFQDSASPHPGNGFVHQPGGVK